MNILKKNIGTNQQMNKEYSTKKIFAGGQFQIYIYTYKYKINVRFNVAKIGATSVDDKN